MFGAGRGGEKRLDRAKPVGRPWRGDRGGAVWGELPGWPGAWMSQWGRREAVSMVGLTAIWRRHFEGLARSLTVPTPDYVSESGRGFVRPCAAVVRRRSATLLQ